VSQAWKRIQRRLGIAADGIPGELTAAAVEAALPPAASAEPTGPFDDRTERNIATLLPQVQPIFRDLFAEALAIGLRSGIVPKILSGNRTWAEQDALYAKGRTKPGPKVTNAIGGGSLHNYGIAVDLGCFSGGRYLDDGTSADKARASAFYRSLSIEAEKMGLEWGGNWATFRDEPHFQVKTGLTMAQMRTKIEAGESIV